MNVNLMCEFVCHTSKSNTIGLPKQKIKNGLHTDAVKTAINFIDEILFR